MPITTLLFDVGGVLIAPLDATAVADQRTQLAHELGFPDADTMWLHFYTGPEWLAAKTGASTEAEMWAALLTPLGLTTAAAQNQFRQRLFAGEGVAGAMRALVQAVHGRYRLAILSNASDILEARLEQVDLARYFDPVINSHRVRLAKPDPAIYQLTLDRLGVPASEVYFIDNFERNTRAAEQMGIASHVFTAVDTLRADMAGRGLL